MTQIFSKAPPTPPPAPTPLPPPTMPDPSGPQAQAAARQTAAAAASRAGRSSTILTTAANRAQKTIAGAGNTSAPGAYTAPNLAGN